MSNLTYSRSPKALLGGIAHLGRFMTKFVCGMQSYRQLGPLSPNCITFLIPPLLG